METTGFTEHLNKLKRQFETKTREYLENMPSKYYTEYTALKREIINDKVTDLYEEAKRVIEIELEQNNTKLDFVNYTLTQEENNLMLLLKNKNYKGVIKILLQKDTLKDFPKQDFLALFYELGLGFNQDMDMALTLYELGNCSKNIISMIRLSLMYSSGNTHVNINKTTSDLILCQLKLVKNKGLIILLKFAFEGIDFAQNIIGALYYEGIFFNKNRNKAFYWLSKAFKTGNRHCINLLAECYLYGRGVNKSESKALLFYKLGVIEDDDVCINNLGYCYEKGHGVNLNYNFSLTLYKYAAEKGNIAAYNAIGYFSEVGLALDNDFFRAATFYGYAAFKGHPAAQCNLAFCFQQGLGLQQNSIFSIHFFKSSAIQGLSRAQHNLAQCYLKGVGVKKDDKKFLYWIRKSIMNRNYNALYTLSCYYTLQETDQTTIGADNLNYKKAIMLSELSSQKGFAQSKIFLSICYRHGRGVKMNLEKSFDYMQQAAYTNNKSAQQLLGLFYEIGSGTKQDLKKAFIYYKKAAKQEHPPALHSVGEYYMRETAVVQTNIGIAMEYFKKAIDKGHYKSFTRLGQCYQLQKDDKNAIDNFLKGTVFNLKGCFYNVGEYILSTEIKNREELSLMFFYKGLILGDQRCENRMKKLMGKFVVLDKKGLPQSVYQKI